MRFLLRLRTLLLALASAFAYVTIVTIAAQFWQWSFSTYTLLCALGLLGGGFVVYRYRSRLDLVDVPFFGTSNFEIPRVHLLYVSGIALLYGLVAVLTVRPNPDDFYYFANAFFYYQNPDASMGYQVHALIPLTEPFVSARWAVSGPYEYFVAACARTIPLPFLTWAHIVMPFFHGVLWAAVLYYAVVVLTGNYRYAIHGFVVAALVVFVLGESQYGPLHYSLLRFSQAKAAFLSYGIPLFVVESYVFFRSPRIRNALFLAVLLIAAIGMTTTGYLLILMMNVIVVVAIITYVTRVRLQHPHWILLWINDSAGRVGLYLATAIPVLLYSYWLRLPSAQTPTSDSLPNKYWPTDFWGHAVLLYNPRFPITPVFLALTLVAAAFVLKPRLRRLLYVFVGVIVIGYLNPMVARSVILLVTQPNTYWRVFYLGIPMVVVGVVAAGLSRYLRYRWRAWRSYVALFALLWYLALLADAPSSILKQPNQLTQARIQRWGIERALWKIPLTQYDIAAEVIRKAPPGPVLAPELISGNLVLRDTRYPVLAIRSEAELYWGFLEKNLKQMTARTQAALFLDGEIQGKTYVLETELATEHQVIQTIVVRIPVYRRPEINALLREYGYTRVGGFQGYVVLTRK